MDCFLSVSQHLLPKWKDILQLIDEQVFFYHICTEKFQGIIHIILEILIIVPSLAAVFV